MASSDRATPTPPANTTGGQGPFSEKYLHFGDLEAPFGGEGSKGVPLIDCPAPASFSGSQTPVWESASWKLRFLLATRLAR